MVGPLYGWQSLLPVAAEMELVRMEDMKSADLGPVLGLIPTRDSSFQRLEYLQIWTREDILTLDGRRRVS